MSDVTRILKAIERGDGDPKREESRLGTHTKATDELLSLVYDELRLLAAQKLSQEAPGQTLQATALVHEAYLRLLEADDQDWNSKGHFFKAAAEAMRRILVENARRKKRIRHGGEHHRVELDEADLAVRGPSCDLLDLDESLARLEAQEPAIAELVKLRVYAGLTLDQAAKVMSVSTRTAIRYWVYARAWLYKEVGKG